MKLLNILLTYVSNKENEKKTTHAVSCWKAGKNSRVWRAGGRGVVTQEVCQASMNLFISKGSCAGEETLLRLCQLLLFPWHHLRSTSTAMGRQKDILATIDEHLRIRNKLVRQALAEFLGTLILVVSGRCSVGCSLTCGLGEIVLVKGLRCCQGLHWEWAQLWCNLLQGVWRTVPVCREKN